LLGEGELKLMFVIRQWIRGIMLGIRRILGYMTVTERFLSKRMISFKMRYFL